MPKNVVSPPISWDTAVSGTKTLREEDGQCLHTHTLHSHEELPRHISTSFPRSRPEEPSPASSHSMGLKDGYVYEAKKRTVTLEERQESEED